MLDPKEEKTDTKKRILDAAERQFALAGFSATSVRTITSAAGVNLAAAHYHFGSKEDLVREVFARRIIPINKERSRVLAKSLDESSHLPRPSLEGIVEAFVGPALRCAADPKSGGELFTRLLGRTHSEPEEFLNRLVGEFFVEIHGEFHTALQRALPDNSAAELYWKFHFMVGAMALTMAAPKTLYALSKGSCDVTDVETSLAHLVSFVVGGMQGSPGKHKLNHRSD